MGYMNAPLNIYESFGHYFLKGIFFFKDFFKSTFWFVQHRNWTQKH